MKPSVSRIVHYVAYGAPPKADGTLELTSEHRAAIITAVKSDTEVDLVVFYPTFVFFDQGVPYVGPTSAGFDRATGTYPRRTWHWPELVD